ncbi:acyl-CoA thioesterase [Actinacidiphila glaucinigra]
MTTAEPGRQEWAAVRRRVEHVDTDASGVVHFSRYSSLLETAVLENLDRLGAGLDALARENLELVVTEISVRHHASARFLDHLCIRVAVDKVGPARFRIGGEVLREIQGDDRVLLASGTVLFGAVDTVSGAPSVLPEDIRNILKECAQNAGD